MTKDDWYKYYTPENKKILDMFPVVKYGDVRIEIHNKKPVIIYATQKFRLQKDKPNETNFTKLQIMAKE